VRGSDPDAALYWLARMLEGGEDPLFIARRLVRMASEDIGAADPLSLLLTTAAKDAYDFLGSPRASWPWPRPWSTWPARPSRTPSTTPTRPPAVLAKETGSLMPPSHILNAPTKLMKSLGYGDGYAYDHDVEGGVSGQNYFPDGMERPAVLRAQAGRSRGQGAERLDAWSQVRKGGKCASSGLRSR
jgi:putative ATPase